MTRIDTIVAAATPPGRGGIGDRARLGSEDAGDRRGDARRAAAATARRPSRDSWTRNSSPSTPAWRCSSPRRIPTPASTCSSCRATADPWSIEAVVARVLELGARRAQPGEFTQRAFLNDKLDLAQAEAIADLIDAGSREAARAAMRSLQGEFSAMVQGLTEAVIDLRTYVEAAIDFPEEEIDFLADRAARRAHPDRARSFRRGGAECARRGGCCAKA